VFTGRSRELTTEAAVFVTARLPDDAVYRELHAHRSDWPHTLQTVKAVGDCLAPGTIAAAVWEGRRYAEELDEPDDRGDTVPFRREVTGLAGPTR
jgi:dimethylamine/trimethylamine dehydrogenase